MLPLLHEESGPVINFLHKWEHLHNKWGLQSSLMGATISKSANGHLRSILSLLFLFFVGVDKSTEKRAWFFIRPDSNSNDQGQGRSLRYCLLPLVSPLGAIDFLFLYLNVHPGLNGPVI